MRLSPHLQNLVPQRIGTQIAMLVIISFVLAHAVVTATFLFKEPPPNIMKPHSVQLGKLLFLAELLDKVSGPDNRSDILQAARNINPDIKLLKELPVPQGEDSRMLKDIQNDYDGRVTIFSEYPQSKGFSKSPGLSAGVQLSSGAVLAMPLLLSQPPHSRIFSPLLFGILFFLGMPVLLLSLWAARALTLPLERFADAAEHFTLSSSDASLAEQGPMEVRKLAEALNNMQKRIRLLMEERTQMLAAVGHDLRTPITRLRLRAEYIEKDSLKQQVFRDLETMENLVKSTLTFLRDETSKNHKIKTDLPSLVQTVCDDFSDTGRMVKLSCISDLHIECDPEQLSRAISNLIENGLKFGRSVTVRVDAPVDGVLGDVARIAVCDDGPGIPDIEKERVLKPFYRSDAARDLNEDDSFGLGLSIVQSIVEAHNGKLELLDAKPTGLIVLLTLPVT